MEAKSEGRKQNIDYDGRVQVIASVKIDEHWDKDRYFFNSIAGRRIYEGHLTSA